MILEMGISALRPSLRSLGISRLGLLPKEDRSIRVGLLEGMERDLDRCIINLQEEALGSQILEVLLEAHSINLEVQTQIPMPKQETLHMVNPITEEPSPSSIHSVV
jgi:hypothetical protein